MLNLVMADGAKVGLKLRLHVCLVEITGSHMAKTHTSMKLSITIIHRKLPLCIYRPLKFKILLLLISKL